MNEILTWRNAMTFACLLALPLGASAGHHWWWDDNDEEEIPFDEAHVFFELNDTDGDLGIHAKIDGDEWKYLAIEDPRERRMLRIAVNGRLRRQGLTEIFFESAEPTFDELPPNVFFNRFPEGVYEVEGITLDGEEMESESEITHLIPAAPVPTVNDDPFVTDCDAEELPAYSLDDGHCHCMARSDHLSCNAWSN